VDVLQVVVFESADVRPDRDIDDLVLFLEAVLLASGLESATVPAFLLLLFQPAALDGEAALFALNTSVLEGLTTAVLEPVLVGTGLEDVGELS
jgi:hypothetical protein